jgi:hypothetical protein
MCNAPATGREHVPPLCIFPKDAQYRKDLITVPSCDEHNLRKSMSDEYMKFIVTVVEGRNELGRSIFRSVLRSFDYDHRPHLKDKFMPNPRPIQVGEHETGEFTLDKPRLEHCIKSIVRGLYFHNTREKLLSEFSGVFWEKMRSENYSIATAFEKIRMVPLPPPNYVGSNPRIFQYAFDKAKSGKTSICRLRFYEVHPICISWKNLNVPTNTLAP